MGKKKLLVDIGSTFTKIVAIDLEQEIVLSSVKSPTTIKNGVTIGVLEALKIIEIQTGPLDKNMEIAACSSAAGGLRMVSIGLVPELKEKESSRLLIIITP